MHVEPATTEMFDDIYALLQDFDAHRMTRDDWRKMLCAHGWQRSADPYGYVLTDGVDVTGFIGTLHSTQTIHDEEHRFCNLSSWIVKKEHRLQALRMLAPVLADEQTTFTGLTLIEATAKIFRKRGFQDLETEALVLSPLSSVTAPRSIRRCSWTADRGEIAATLRGRDLEVFHAHEHARCGHLLLQWKGATCYVLTTTWRLKGRPVSHVHYVSDRERFWSHLGAVQWAVLRAQKTPLVMIDKRQAGRSSVPFALRYRLQQPRLYRPSRARPIAPDDVTALYSEMMWLRV